MPNINDVDNYLKADHLTTGDLIWITDAGRIEMNKSFLDKASNTEQKKNVLILSVNVNGKSREWTLNATSRAILGAAWGPNTELWAGRAARAVITKQLVAGSLKSILSVEPVPDHEVNAARAANNMPPLPQYAPAGNNFQSRTVIAPPVSAQPLASQLGEQQHTIPNMPAKEIVWDE